MGTMRSIAFLFFLLGCLSQATSFTHRHLSASSKMTLEDSKNSTGSGSPGKVMDTVAPDSTGSRPLPNNTSSTVDDSDASSPRTKRPTKGNTTVVTPGEQETDYVNTSISQWDITNKSMISMNHSVSNSTSFLPKERPQSTGWIQICLGIFLGLAVILFGLTTHQKYRKRMHYEDAPEMQSLVV